MPMQWSVFYEASPAQDFAVDWVGRDVDSVVGRGAAELVGRSRLAIDRVHPDDQDTIVQYLTSLMYRELAVAEYRWRCPNGVYRWLRSEAAVHCDPKGRRSDRIVGTWRDIDHVPPRAGSWFATPGSP
jgi:hypothetical protein